MNDPLASANTLTLEANDRPTWPSILRGWSGRCPACGEGKLFSGYLKVADHCPSCGEDFTPQRADDGPAYLTILVVGHLMAPLILVVFTLWRPEPWVLITTFSSGVILLSLWLLPRFKGGLVALQWAKRMHGFGGA